MNKLFAAAVPFVAIASMGYAQNLTIGGFLEFEAAFGDNYDFDAVAYLEWLDGTEPYSNAGFVNGADFGVDGRLEFDYSNSTKSGLEYGAHFELDLYQSDGVLRSVWYDGDEANPIIEGDDANGSIPYYSFGMEDRLVGDSVSFNDGYVFINSALGNVKLGDAGAAGAARNQLNVPYLINALERDQYPTAELELIKYENSFLGVDFAASVDDDSNWNLGIGYAAAVGSMDVALGLSAGEYTLAGSLGATVGGLTFGVNYAMEEVDATSEYIAAGVGYSMGALTIGTGVETEIRHGDIHLFQHNSPTGQEYETNYFVGASYELADGLLLSLGLANLDSDSVYNWSEKRWRRSGRGFDANSSDYARGGFKEGRAWTAGASVKVAF